MSIASINDLLTAMPSAQRTQIFKASATTKGTGYYHSTWKLAGEPAAGATPTTGNGALCDYTTTGAMQIRAPGSGNTLYIGGAEILGGANPAAIIFYDRIWANSGLSGTSTSAQTFTTPGWGRATDGIGLEIWIEIYTALGATNTTITVSYTNTDSTAGRSGVYSWTGGAPVAGQMIRIPWQAGDKGVLSIESVTLSASTGTAGDFGVTVAKRLTTIGPPTTACDKRDWHQLGLPVVESGACMAAILACSGTTIAGSYVDLLMPEG